MAWGGNGLFCGASTQLGFDANAADPSTLYLCVNGSAAQRTTCPAGCKVAPANEADHCSPDPCAPVSAASNGVFCGTSKQAAFKTSVADPSVLYTCRSGVTIHRTACAAGCVVAAAGQDDRCN